MNISAGQNLQRIFLITYRPSQVIWEKLVGRAGHNLRRGPNMRRFGPSCIRWVYFLCKSTEFHVIQTECQRIIPTDYFSQSLAISERSLYSLPDYSPIAPLSLPGRSNPASVYPPYFDTLEWMEMQTGLPLYGLLKLWYQNSPLPHRLKTWTLLQR